MLVLALAVFGFCGFLSAIVFYGQLRQMNAYHGLLASGPRCPKCEIDNTGRVEDGLPLLPDVTTRRDGAIYCRVHDETFYPMSEDSVMRYTPRYHSPERNAA